MDINDHEGGILPSGKKAPGRHHYLCLASWQRGRRDDFIDQDIICDIFNDSVATKTTTTKTRQSVRTKLQRLFRAFSLLKITMYTANLFDNILFMSIVMLTKF